MLLKAIIFDVDGTLADTEQLHLEAFNLTFAEFALPWHWSTELYRQLLLISGGKERIEHYYQSISADRVAISYQHLVEILAQMHSRKNAIYSELVASGKCPFRPGIADLLDSARQNNLDLAIATTTSSENIDALLRANIGTDWKKYFKVIEDASSAKLKKPHPQVYQQCLARLNLSAHECLALEDSNNGLQAAVSCAIPVLITHNQWTKDQDFHHALAVLDDLSATNFLTIQQIFQSSVNER